MWFLGTVLFQRNHQHSFWCRQCLRDARVSMTCRHMGAFLTAVPQPRFQSLGQPCKENTAILSAAELTLPQGMGLAGVLAVDSTVT